MKAFTVFAASAVVAMASIDSVVGLAKYLDELPNGELFEKSLGHTASGYSDFGTAFSKNGATWTTDFCKATYPGTTITNGAAFGDPCCTWKKGGAADKTVNAWTDKPMTATVCDSAAAATTAPAATSAAPASTPATSKADSSSSSASTPAPAATTAAPSSSGDKATPAATKKNLRKCKVKEEKSQDDDEDQDADDDDN